MHLRHNGQKRRAIEKSVISALVCFALLIGVYHIILYHDMAADKERYGYIARYQAEHIITMIDCVMSRTNTLKTMIKDNDGDTSWFEEVAADLYTAVQDETGVSLKNLAIAPGGVVADVYPREGNEALIGFDFLDTSRPGNLEAQKAYEHNKTIITNPFELVQGGVGMGGRAAVILQNDGTDYLWGLVTVTIDFENLMKVSRMDSLHDMGVEYSLSYIDDDGNAQFIYGTGDIGNDTVKTRFDVRNLSWELEVRPEKGWLSIGRAFLAISIILTLSVLAGVLTYMMIQIRESNELLRNISVTDALSGCQNRRAYEDKIKELSPQKPDDDLVYISADLNGLKQ
ncbi:MAG: CHASE domain-containing protein, partial [Lachnospiraceae bacterium]|nr:CHASE domain-containing protein [Lachnospiraceae bacterium]